MEPNFRFSSSPKNLSPFGSASSFGIEGPLEGTKSNSSKALSIFKNVKEEYGSIIARQSRINELVAKIAKSCTDFISHPVSSVASQDTANRTLKLLYSSLNDLFYLFHRRKLRIELQASGATSPEIRRQQSGSKEPLISNVFVPQTPKKEITTVNPLTLDLARSEIPVANKRKLTLSFMAANTEMVATCKSILQSLPQTQENPFGKAKTIWSAKDLDSIKTEFRNLVAKGNQLHHTEAPLLTNIEEKKSPTVSKLLNCSFDTFSDNRLWNHGVAIKKSIQKYLGDNLLISFDHGKQRDGCLFPLSDHDEKLIEKLCGAEAIEVKTIADEFRMLDTYCEKLFQLAEICAQYANSEDQPFRDQLLETTPHLKELINLIKKHKNPFLIKISEVIQYFIETELEVKLDILATKIIDERKRELSLEELKHSQPPKHFPTSYGELKTSLLQKFFHQASKGSNGLEDYKRPLIGGYISFVDQDNNPLLHSSATPSGTALLSEEEQLKKFDEFFLQFEKLIGKHVFKDENFVTTLRCYLQNLPEIKSLLAVNHPKVTPCHIVIHLTIFEYLYAELQTPQSTVIAGLETELRKMHPESMKDLDFKSMCEYLFPFYRCFYQEYLVGPQFVVTPLFKLLYSNKLIHNADLTWPSAASNRIIVKFSEEGKVEFRWLSRRQIGDKNQCLFNQDFKIVMPSLRSLNEEKEITAVFNYQKFPTTSIQETNFINYNLKRLAFLLLKVMEFPSAGFVKVEESSN